MKIGIPNTLTYTKYQKVLTSFFKELNIELITPKIDEEIKKLGNIHIDEDCCEHIIDYIGSVEYLKDKCDYVLIIDIKSLKEKDKVCPLISNLINIVKINFKELKVLKLTIDINKKKDELSELIKIGQKLKIKSSKIIDAYKKTTYNLENTKKPIKYRKEDKKKIIIAGNFYSVNNFVEKNLTIPGYNIIYSNDIDYRYDSLKNDMLVYTNNTFTNEYIKSISDNIQDLKALILIEEKNCFMSIIYNDMIISKINNIPVLKINNNDQCVEKIKIFLNNCRDNYETYN